MMEAIKLLSNKEQGGSQGGGGGVSLRGTGMGNGAVKVSIVRPLPKVRFPKEVSDWSILIISTLPNSLTRSRG